MTTTPTRRSQGSYVDRPSSSSLADVVELILDKGLVIDLYVRVSLVGIEILTIDARIVIASVDTYLRFAEATNRLDLTQQGGKDLTEMMEGITESGSKGKVGGALEGVKEAFTSDDDEKTEKPKRTATRRQKQSSD
ncbi:MAG TPA: gas vesicle structural protein GvpA [Enteractinococcus helveticum]|uniref:Gas vesicle protein A n=1 Tax=Enteractinococcus helveticum TaxID=1837282 RepID=A0A921FMI1_9MICC|nr:gas vesicle protein GvpJ [Enteractinococcus helveticum]HJF14384.1 gas vesicle structural protein GvpA [Enteractinococcus helveticum]